MAKKKHKKREKKPPEIPVNSFADIAFLLIIFFLVATTLERMTGALSELPSGETGEQQDKTPTVQIHENTITFQDNEVSTAELRERLAKLKLIEREADDRVVALEATGDVKYQIYFDAMCTISAAGGVIAIIKEDRESKNK